MTDRQAISSRFYIDDHAVLYALLVRAAIRRCGPAGERASRQATTLYGRERGVRMAMRCLAAGLPLTGETYLEFGEWFDDRGWSVFRVGSYEPFELNAQVCGWHDSWKKYELSEYGKIYCEIIDGELYRGFNPELELTVTQTLSHGHEKCGFLLSGMACASADDKKLIDERRSKRLKSVVKDFLYHAGHLLSAFRRTWLLELGLPLATEMLAAASTEYEKIFGSDKMRWIILESGQDFLAVSGKCHE